MLGINLELWGGAILRYDAPGHPPMALWNAMPENNDEIVPSHRDFMINFAVDDLDAFVARLEAKGVTILKREEDQTGKFATILYPDGTKSNSGNLQLNSWGRQPTFRLILLSSWMAESPRLRP